MENKSRVLKYQELRKKISNMDVYSFQETDEVRKHLPPVSHDGEKEEETDESSAPIRKNTLSVSLDELIRTNEEQDEQKEKEKTKALYQEKKKEGKKDRHLTQGQILLIVLLSFVLIIALVVLLVVFTKGN